MTEFEVEFEELCIRLDQRDIARGKVDVPGQTLDLAPGAQVNDTLHVPVRKGKYRVKADVWPYETREEFDKSLKMFGQEGAFDESA